MKLKNQIDYILSTTVLKKTLKVEKNNLEKIWKKKGKIDTIYLNPLRIKSHFALEKLYTVHHGEKMQNSIQPWP